MGLELLRFQREEVDTRFQFRRGWPAGEDSHERFNDKSAGVRFSQRSSQVTGLAYSQLAIGQGKRLLGHNARLSHVAFRYARPIEYLQKLHLLFRRVAEIDAAP